MPDMNVDFHRTLDRVTCSERLLKVIQLLGDFSFNFTNDNFVAFAKFAGSDVVHATTTYETSPVTFCGERIGDAERQGDGKVREVTCRYCRKAMRIA